MVGGMADTSGPRQLGGHHIRALARWAEHGTWIVTPVVALVWSAAATMLYAVLGAILGQPQILKVNLGVVVAVVALWNAAVSLPLRGLLSWTSGRRSSPWQSELVRGDRP